MMNLYMRTIQAPLVFITMVIMSVLLFSLFVAQPAGALNPLDASCAQKATLAGSDICNDDTKLFGAGSFWTRLINTFIFVVGAVAVLMLVIGGLRYVLSGGDASQTKSAKDTILYAIIGVVIALMAYAIVNFVVIRLVQ